jgi:beta-galactosidase
LLAGEPTPYAWPDINSHFGILDIAGFPKDRFYWYQAWFAQPAVPVLHVFPHWNWNASTSTVDVWVYSNANEVELFVNGVSAGRKPSATYAHVEWSAVPYAPGFLQAVAYVNGSNTPVAVAFRNTTGTASALLISIKDGIGEQLVAGCADVALVQVQVVDSNGLVVPDASNNITFSVTGPATVAGTGNGDPACHTPDKSSTRPAYHGYVLAVIQGGTSAGTVTVQASSPGLSTVSLQIPTALPPVGFSEYWCHLEPTL